MQLALLGAETLTAISKAQGTLLMTQFGAGDAHDLGRDVMANGGDFFRRGMGESQLMNLSRHGEAVMLFLLHQRRFDSFIAGTVKMAHDGMGEGGFMVRRWRQQIVKASKRRCGIKGHNRREQRC